VIPQANGAPPIKIKDFELRYDESGGYCFLPSVTPSNLSPKYDEFLMLFLTKYFGVTVATLSENSPVNSLYRGNRQEVLLLQANAAARNNSRSAAELTEGWSAPSAIRSLDVAVGRDRGWQPTRLRGVFGSPAYIPRLCGLQTGLEVNSDFKGRRPSLSFSVDLIGMHGCS